ncbi:hypothetical protein LWI29_004903 [Acer saccharum]|uniref:Uncharacterized protein n=1 Tax=Acer saccharum TaxID=4024 RepID=A0AA39T754_ACESA|nr:hypothetical protein LWI29_004903 [Acer saccharum]
MRDLGGPTADEVATLANDHVCSKLKGGSSSIHPRSSNGGSSSIRPATANPATVDPATSNPATVDPTTSDPVASES